MKSFNTIFFRGLITLLPIAITIYVVYSAVIILDSVLGSLLKQILPATIYVPGLGFLLILILIYLFGLLLNNFMISRILSGLEKMLLKEVPFIKAIYSPLRDLMNLFSKSDQKMGAVVLVKMGDSGAMAMGLVTRESFADLSLPGNKFEGKIAVYFPLSYGLGGFTFLVPKTNVEKLDLPVEKAMSLAITGWVKAEKPNE